MSEDEDRVTEEAGTADGTSAPSDGQGPQSLEERIAALEAEKGESRERLLRLAAEFENYKKRVRKDQSDAEAKVRESVLRDVLEIADNLERAAAVDEKSDVKALQQGIGLVLRVLQGKLERYEVRAFEAKGTAFDPRIHDAISQVPTSDAPPGSVVSDVQKGYRIGDRLLRPAMVMVAVAAPNAAPEGSGKP